MRRENFNRVLDLALNATLENWNYENLAAAFPSLNETAPDELEAVRYETESFIRDAVKEEIDAILESNKIMEKIDSFEDILVNHSKKIDPDDTRIEALHTWLEPQEAVHCRVLEIKKRREIEMKRELEELEKENAVLSSEVGQLLEARESITKSIREYGNKLTL